MQAFEYARPKTREDVVRLLGEEPGSAAILAGGTDLLSLMKDRIRTPQRLVSLRDVEELRGVTYDGGTGLRIGAMTSLADLAEHPSLHESYPSLFHAIRGIHGQQIQNMGTVGGELLQWPRCWYYRSGFGLLAMQDGKSLVPEGDNRYHAILGNAGPAYYVNPSSLAPALVALGAKLKVFGPKGEREIAIGDFYQTPQRDDAPLCALGADEIVTAILVPPTQGAQNATYEVRQKDSLDWPLAAAAVSIKTDGGSKVTEAKIVLGHVAPVPWPVPDAAKTLIGGAITEATAAGAGEAAVAGAKALSRNAYKIRLAAVAVKRAILRSFGTEV